MNLKSILLEGICEKTAILFIRDSIKGSEYENHVFLAGGFVRDELLNIDPKDIDCVINLPNGGILFSIWLAKKYNIYKKGSNPVIFENFGTSKLSLGGIKYNGIDLSNIDVECVMTRGEKYTPGSRKPEVNYDDLKTDVFRRDSTANSLLKNISTGEILDLTGRGMSDIRNGILRTPLDPDITFSDDPLRMMRFVRQSSKYEWEISDDALEGIKRNASKLNNISKERIKDELNKILVLKDPSHGIRLLKDTGLLPYIAPELQQAVGMTQNVHHSEDVFNHTLTVLKGTKPELVQRLMALFHDIGKVATRSETPTGVHFYNHEDAGVEIVDRIMRELKYPTELINAVKVGVANHMRLKQGKDEANISDKALRKFKIELGDQLENVLNLIHADNIAHSDASAMPNQIDRVRAKLQALDVQVKKPNLPINGNDLIALGIKPGPVFSKILGAVTDAWYENPSITREQALDIAKRMI